MSLLSGYRKEHNFELIREEEKSEYSPSPKKGGGRFNTDSVDEVVSVSKKFNPKDWQEFYDATTRAKYWFNTVTNEASWTNPFNQHK